MRALPIGPRLATLTVALTVLAAGCSADSTGSTTSSLGPGSHVHTTHLRGGVFGPGGSCPDCHAPSGFAVDFSQNSMVHARGGSFDAATLTCSKVYCHGTFSFNGVTGSNAHPSWTDPTSLGCTSCHAMPPAGHPPLAGAVTATACNACHPRTVNAQGLIEISTGAHVNGKPETAGLGCTTCHGDAARSGFLPGTDVNLPSSPPVASPNARPHAVGAHLGHVNPTAASALMGPIACGECHVVPADSAHANDPPAQPVVFGTLSRTGGAAPTWDPGTAGCSASYCHGEFSWNGVSGSNATPGWTDATALTCTSCHAMPPTGHPAYTGTPSAASCFQCHPQSVNVDGTIKLGGAHLNGRAEGGDCKSCHGDPPTTGKHTIRDHGNLRCDACHPTGYSSATAVAPFHQNTVVDLGPQAGYSCGLEACPSGARGTCTNKCHGTESW